MNYPKGASVLIIQGNDVLAVRRGNSDKWGLPGGRLEEGEGTLEAAVRECAEEAGICLDPAAGKFVYGGICNADHLSKKEYWVDTFMFKMPPSQRACTIEKDNPVKWMPVTEFLSKSSFPDYHKLLFSSVCDIVPSLESLHILHVGPDLN